MQHSRTATAPVHDLVLVKSATVPLSTAACFRLFVEPAGLESWLCEKANVEARVGGRYELFWEPGDPENNSTVGCRITACAPERVLAFEWRSPRQFKSFANAADPLTHVVVAFHAVPGSTTVTLVHSGWRSTAEWQQAAAWQSTAWDHAMQALQARALRPMSPSGSCRTWS
jgi:uncharacterized protein YndB with AHSA1/START domain